MGLRNTEQFEDLGSAHSNLIKRWLISRFMSVFSDDGSEGSADALKEFIAQREQFLHKFPKSHFAAQAKQDITDAQTQLEQALKSGR